MHIRTIHKNGKIQHVTYCSEYAKGKAKHLKCNSPHRIDVDEVMENIVEVLRKIVQYSLENKAEFEKFVKNSLDKEQTEEVKKNQKRMPQITDRMEEIERVMNKLYEDNALGNMDTESYSNFEELTPTIINELISKIVVHERDVKRAKYVVQRIEVYFNYIGKFENELTKQIEPTEQEMKQMRKEIEEAKKEKTRAYHREYSKKYRAKNLEKCREYEKLKAREYRAKKKIQVMT